MQSAALKKIESMDTLIKTPMESWETTRQHIAAQAEAASNLPGNHNAVDFEAYMQAYGIKAAFA